MNEKAAVILETLANVNAVFRDDSTALLSSTAEHKGSVGDVNAAYIALISKLLTLAE